MNRDSERPPRFFATFRRSRLGSTLVYDSIAMRLPGYVAAYGEKCRRWRVNTVDSPARPTSPRSTVAPSPYGDRRCRSCETPLRSRVIAPRSLLEASLRSASHRSSRWLSGLSPMATDADDLEETHSRYALVVSTRSQRLRLRAQTLTISREQRETHSVRLSGTHSTVAPSPYGDRRCRSRGNALALCARGFHALSTSSPTGSDVDDLAGTAQLLGCCPVRGAS